MATSLIDRFMGDAGRPHVIDALKRQAIVAHDEGFAQRLAAVGHPTAFDPGDTLIEQDAADSDVYFILSGDAEVLFNRRPVAKRGPGEVVGEMVAIDRTARRSATVKASTPLVALKVTADDFLTAGEQSDRFWKYVARMMGERLRQHRRFHRPANPVPIMFIGSSTEGIEVARAIQSEFKHDKNVIAHPWFSKGVFGPSGIPIQDLLKAVDEADFAVFIFGPDDKIHSRDEDQWVPRDNVVFEMGLFMARLGRDRVLMVMEADADLKMPSDLSGLTPVTYVCKQGCNWSDQIGPVCNEIRDVIREKGVL